MQPSDDKRKAKLEGLKHLESVGKEVAINERVRAVREKAPGPRRNSLK